jgi:Tfp pilus assembly protein PilX
MMRLATHTRHSQRGATMLVTLIMLVMLTMFAVAGFNMSSINLKIASNFQQQKNMEMVVQQAIEQAISAVATFTPAPAAQTITVSGIPVTLTAATCYHTTAADGYELNVGTPAPEDNVWEIRGSATDPFGGARATITQGVRLRMLPRNCL